MGYESDPVFGDKAAVHTVLDLHLLIRRPADPHTSGLKTHAK